MKIGLTARQKFVVGLWLRVVSAGVFLIFIGSLHWLHSSFPLAECYLAYYGLAALVGFNGLYWLVGKNAQFPLWHFYGHWFIDLILISAVIFGLGGYRLPSSVTPYLLIVITSAVFQSQRASFAVASGASCAYAGLIGVETLGVMSPPYQLDTGQFSTGMQIFALGTPVLMLHLVAYIAGTLADDLNAANRLLGEQNERLGRHQQELDFQARVIAHDFRSPIAAAAGALGLLERGLASVEGPDREKMSELFQIVGANLDHADELVESLRDAQQDPGASEEKSLLEPLSVFAEVALEFRGDCERRGVAIMFSGEPPLIFAARRQLTIILRNLIGNALRYVPDGNGRVSVTAVERDGGVLLAVSDNGCGIPSQYHEVIFEAFRKAPQARKSPGIGVGLALVKRAVDNHQGRVWVESREGDGASFKVFLPGSSEVRL